MGTWVCHRCSHLNVHTNINCARCGIPHNQPNSIPIHCNKKMDAVGVIPSERRVDYGNITQRAYWTNEKIVYHCSECGKSVKLRPFKDVSQFYRPSTPKAIK